MDSVICLQILFFFFFNFVHGGQAEKAMMLERDGETKGWVAYEGTYRPEDFEFDRDRVCFKCPDFGALNHLSYNHWFVNRAAEGEDPDWGSATMRCLSKWEQR